MALSIACNLHLELTKTNQQQYHWPYHYFYQYHLHHLYQRHYHSHYPLFSLNFTSAGKGPVLASKAKNMHQRHTFLGRGGGRGVVEWGTWPHPHWEILELSFLKHRSLILRPILWKSAIVILREQKTIDSNNFTVSSMSSLQNAWPIKRKAAYTLVLFHIQLFRERLSDKMRTRQSRKVLWGMINRLFLTL